MDQKMRLMDLNQWQRHRFALLDVTIVIIAGAQEPIPCG
jgi:hypothetical protein